MWIFEDLMNAHIRSCHLAIWWLSGQNVWGLNFTYGDRNLCGVRTTVFRCSSFYYSLAI